MTRKIRVFLSVLCILLLTSSSLAHPGRTDSEGGHYNRKTGVYHYHNSGRRSSPPPQTKTTQKKADPISIAANGLYYVRVTRVIDGDTVEVAFNDTHKERVRLIGVDTPETVHPQKAAQKYGKEASDYTKKELTDKKVWLNMDIELRDKYKRLLGYIWMEKPNDGENEQEVRSKMFNARLLLEGYAQVMTIQPNSKYANLFVKFQQEARDSEKGLWGK